MKSAENSCVMTFLGGVRSARLSTFSNARPLVVKALHGKPGLLSSRKETFKRGKVQQPACKTL